ncbi:MULTISPECIES: hypothetical protein [Limimaricola]|uniref:hypothetical protein n=1 Tax=Limimaricola TaxID=2211638 RepID=UPI002AC93099|nr:hypothetical protein [Limimaricola variabilis]WPY95614.1 hypothetical protein T8T21_05685 [Limimaricola variabilis]
MIRDLWVRLLGRQRKAAIEAERIALEAGRRQDVEGVVRRAQRIDQLVNDMKRERQLGTD